MINVLDLIREKGIDPKKVAGTYGGEYQSPCPACGGNDRFHVWPEQNNGQGSWWCRQCEKSGDAIQFLRDFCGLSYQDACAKIGRTLHDDFRYQTPHPPRSSKPAGSNTYQPQPIQPPAEKWQERATLFVNWAHDRLLENKHRLSWLKKRGIAKDTVRRFRLGWNPGKDGEDRLFRPRETWGLKTIVKENGRKKVLWLPIGLVIPYFQGDQIRRIRIRRPKKYLKKIKSKYYILPGSVMDCMLTRPGSRAYMVIESELDAILCDQEAGDICGAVALGSSSAKPDVGAAQELAAAALILLALDYDMAGAKAISWWQEQYPQVERWPAPEGKDPGEAYQEGVDIAAWIRSGLPPPWRNGPSLEKKKKKKAAKKEDVRSSADVPPAVLELADILKQHPVAISVTAERTHIRYTQKWARQNWDTSKRLSELVFMTDEVMDFLEDHPDEVITGECFKFVGPKPKNYCGSEALKP